MVQHAQWCFRALQDRFHHLENVRAFSCVSCPNNFLHAENNPELLKNSTEHTEPLFIALISNHEI